MYCFCGFCWNESDAAIAEAKVLVGKITKTRED